MTIRLLPLYSGEITWGKRKSFFESQYDFFQMGILNVKYMSGELTVQRQLKRDLDRAALIRLEEAARSEDDFRIVTKNWDRLDANRERKERYHEQCVTNDMFDWNMFEERVGYEEDFLNLIFLCPCQMHNLVDDPDISCLVKNATNKQKTVFFSRVILNWPPKKTAQFHEMTDRNVRGLVSKMVNKIRRGLFEALKRRLEDQVPMSLTQQAFLAICLAIEKIKDCQDAEAEIKRIDNGESQM